MEDRNISIGESKVDHMATGFHFNGVEPVSGHSVVQRYEKRSILVTGVSVADTCIGN